jgi:two-component system cell cycle sensor histidine kinase/response regulator CckA
LWVAVERRRRQRRATATVLGVDDEPTICLVVARMLAEAGFRVYTAMSGPDALQKMPHIGPIHVLLTDLRMPSMNGVELATVIRDIRPEARVLLMAGFPSEDLVQYRVLVKPFEPEQLEGEIRQLLDGGS